MNGVATQERLPLAPLEGQQAPRVISEVARLSLPVSVAGLSFAIKSLEDIYGKGLVVASDAPGSALTLVIARAPRRRNARGASGYRGGALNDPVA